jgi:hypothetical protein
MSKDSILQRLRVLEKIVLKGILEPGTVEVRNVCRKSHNEKLLKLYL